MPNKSKFVSVVSWIFLVLSVLGILLSVFQFISLKLILAGQFPDMPVQGSQIAIEAFSKSMMQFLIVVMGIFIVFFITAFGLLKRKNWARYLLIVLLSLAILWQLAGLVFQYFIMEDIDPALIESGTVSPTSDTLILVVATVIISLSVWLIKRFSSQSVIGEFKQ